MPSPESQRFLQSMNIGYEEWHDGIGYDLEALENLGPEEKQQAENLLVSRCSDFRGIKELDTLGTDRALDRIEGLKGNDDHRVHAAAPAHFPLGGSTRGHRALRGQCHGAHILRCDPQALPGARGGRKRAYEAHV